MKPLSPDDLQSDEEMVHLTEEESYLASMAIEFGLEFLDLQNQELDVAKHLESDVVGDGGCNLHLMESNVLRVIVDRMIDRLKDLRAKLGNDNG
jgi:hypothetical protein